MRKTFIALVVVSGVMAIAAVPSLATAAAVTPLRPQRVVTGATWLGQADARSIGYRTAASGGVAVRVTDAGRTAVVPAPEGCTATAIGGGRVAYACGAVTQVDPNTMAQPLAVTSLTGGAVVRVTRNEPLGASADEATSPPGAVGNQWIWFSTSGYHGPFDSYYNWRTGELRYGQPLDPLRTLDLDAPDLATPLCSPLRSVRAETQATESPRMLPVTVRKPWVLIDTQAHAELHRCGTAKPVALPAPFGAEDLDPVLGDGWLAQPIWRGPGIRSVELLRLSDRRRFTIRTTASVGALTHRRLYLRSGTTGNETISMVSLPRRY
ncbi:MAG TPA: hypothetical protein VI318_03005 [Baekduia sp.]